MLPLLEAASLAKLTPTRLAQLCRAGRIRGAVKTGRDWRVPARFKIKGPTRPVGRPKAKP